MATVAGRGAGAVAGEVSPAAGAALPDRTDQGGSGGAFGSAGRYGLQPFGAGAGIASAAFVAARRGSDRCGPRAAAAAASRRRSSGQDHSDTRWERSHSLAHGFHFDTRS